MRIWISLLVFFLFFLFSCGSGKVYQNAAQITKIERDTVYISQTDWEKVKELAKENHLLRVEIDQLKKKIALMEIRYVIEKKSK